MQYQPDHDGDIWYDTADGVFDDEQTARGYTTFEDVHALRIVARHTRQDVVAYWRGTDGDAGAPNWQPPPAVADDGPPAHGVIAYATFTAEPLPHTTQTFTGVVLAAGAGRCGGCDCSRELLEFSPTGVIVFTQCLTCTLHDDAVTSITLTPARPTGHAG